MLEIGFINTKHVLNDGMKLPPKTKRRAILKSGLAGLGSAAMWGDPTLASRSPDQMVVLKGTPERPITRKAAQREVGKLVDRLSLPDERDSVLYALPDVPGSEYYTAGYIVKIGEDGVGMTHVNYGKPGVKGDFRETLHDLVDQRRSEMERAEVVADYDPSPSIESSGGDVGTKTYSEDNVTFDDGWQKYSFTDSFAEGDNGEVSLNGRHAQLQEDIDGSDSYDQWGASFNYRSTPKTNNNVRNFDKAKYRQDWSEGYSLVKNDHVYDTDPSGERDGTWTFSAEVSGVVGTDTSLGASIGWSYTQPDLYMTERTDQDGNDGDAVWIYERADKDVYDTTLDVTCGSVVYVYDGVYSCPASLGPVSNWSHFNDIWGSSISCSADMSRCES